MWYVLNIFIRNETIKIQLEGINLNTLGLKYFTCLFHKQASRVLNKCCSYFREKWCLDQVITSVFQMLSGNLEHAKRSFHYSQTPLALDMNLFFLRQSLEFGMCRFQKLLTTNPAWGTFFFFTGSRRTLHIECLLQFHSVSQPIPAR